MKKQTFLAALAFLILACSLRSWAQSDDRYKLTMQIQHQGKAVQTEISTVNYSFYRSPDEQAKSAPDKQNNNTANPAEGSTSPTPIYLTLSMKTIPKELIEIMADAAIKFDGSITITDSYGKSANREIKFKNAYFNAASENFAVYSNTEGSASLTIQAGELWIDGVKIKQ